MHDPMTVAFEIRSPFRDKPSEMFPEGYRRHFITIWHKDPCRDGSDDSCRWFGGVDRPWWRHPRWHVWHWRIQIHPLQRTWQWLFDRCAMCGGRFKFYEGRLSSWDGGRCWHFKCDTSTTVDLPELDRAAKGGE